MERLPDDRLRVTRIYSVLNSIPKSPTKLIEDVWLNWGTPDAEFTDCRLIKQDVSGQDGPFRTPCEEPPKLVRVYEQISATEETQVGEPDVSVNQYGYKEVTFSYIQFSEGTPVYSVPGVTPAPAPWPNCILRDQVDTDDGTLRTIKRTYVQGGQLADYEELKFGGALLLRTIKSLLVEPTTPAGYNLVTQSVEYINGCPVYAYGYASASGGGGGGGGGTGGVISQGIEYKISPDQGETGVTVTTIRYLTGLTVTGNPITPPAGSELIQVNFEDESGYRMWTAVYARGQGVVTTVRSVSESGALVTYSTTSINAVPPTPSATIGGAVTLVRQNQRNGTDAASGTVVYDYDWVEANGEVARGFTNTDGGAVDFDPANPTSSIGVVICTTRYLTSTAATSDPTVGPAGFVRISSESTKSAGYLSWSTRWAYGNGLVQDDVEYRNQGRLTIYHRISLNSPPEPPTVFAEAPVSDIVLTNPGSGYTAAPTVTISGGGGSGATAVAVMAGTSIAAITLTSAGTGYTSTPTVSLVGGGGSGATAVAAITPTTVASLTLNNAGSGYSTAPTVNITGGGGTGATATAALAAAQVYALSLTAPGSGYTSAPTVGFTGGGGTGAAATAALTGTSVATATLTNAGSGYTSVPSTSVTGGGGSGAVITPVMATTSISAVNVTNFGSGYVQAAPSVGFSGGGGSGATATATTRGAISSVTVTSAGSGYTGSFLTVPFSGGGGSPGSVIFTLNSGVISGVYSVSSSSDYTSPPTFDFTGLGGTGGAATLSIYGGGLLRVIAGSASGYTSTPTVSITGGGGSGATAIAILNSSSPGSIYLTLTNPGSGYTSLPTVTITGGGGTANGSATINTTRQVISVQVTSGGSGYTSAPTVSITGGGGTGAAATASLASTSVASLTVTSPGSGYTSTPTLTISGTATGTLALTPTSVASLTLTNPGSGYTTSPTVGFTGGGGTGATATAAIASPIASLTLTAPGSGYTSPPSVGFTGGGGSGAAATANLTPVALASVTLTAPGSGYTGEPSVIFSGGGGSGATADADLTPTSIAGINLLTGGSDYTTTPTVSFSAGTAAAFAVVQTLAPEVNLIQSNFRHETGYDIYDYRWAAGIGVIEERTQQREGGLRLETWTSFGYQTGTALFIPPGIPIDIDKEFQEGVTKWTVSCMQDSDGGDPTDGFEFAFETKRPFRYPGRAKAFINTFTLLSQEKKNYDVFQSPPITVVVDATVEITYQTSPNIGALTYPLWNPDEWATIFASFLAIPNRPTSPVISLPEYRSVDDTPIYFNGGPVINVIAESCMETPVQSFGAGTSMLPFSIRVIGGPEEPDGNTYTLAVEVEPAFTDITGVQYYRRTVVYAEIPAQPALPV